MIVFLFLALGSAYLLRNGNGRGDGDAYSEKRVSLEEIEQELSFGVYAEEDWKAFFAEGSGDYLTCETLEGLLERISVSEYIELPGMTGRHTVTREEWNQIYIQILDILDMERSIETQKILILDVMEAQEANVLITNQGDYYTSLPASYFQKWKGYDLYCREERCIGIAGENAEELPISNAYLAGASAGKVKFLYDGGSYTKEIGELLETVEQGVCDLVFAEGNLVSIRRKQDVINGALLSYDDAAIEIEGYGKIAHEGKIPVYQTYGEIKEMSLSDVVLGNMEVEYVTGEEQVCAILIRQPAKIQNIRVLLLSSDGTNFRQEVYLKCDTAAMLKCGTWEERVEASVVIPATELLMPNPDATLILTPESEQGLITVCDADGNALSNGYAGSMEVRGRQEGYTLVNELPFETYLCAVVPSEMPSTYAPEALKAQAVCARSYAYIQLLRGDLAKYGAHINDSTAYQVYNKTAATEAAKQAVLETSGQVLTYQGKVVEAYYFSTSMGYTDTAEIWNVDDVSDYGYLKRACLNRTEQNIDLSNEDIFLEYIGKKLEAYDSDVKYYRWFASADYREKTDEINQILWNRRAVSKKNVIFYSEDGTQLADSAERGNIEAFGDIRDISVSGRSASGSILTLRIIYEKGEAEVKTEYNIRKVLGAGVVKMVYGDSSESEQVTMLPSAFCAIVPKEDGTVILQGGGYGHGLGMSQNGANGMAEAGMSYEEILQYFYNDITLSEM